MHGLQLVQIMGHGAIYPSSYKKHLKTECVCRVMAVGMHPDLSIIVDVT